MSLTEKTELRRFGLMLGFVLTVLGFLPAFKGKNINPFLIIPALALLLLALTIPNLLSPLYRAWMRLGEVLGRISSFIILSVIFYFVLTPIGIVRRMLTRSSEKFAYKTNKDSYWIKRAPGNPKEEMKRPF